MLFNIFIWMKHVFYEINSFFSAINQLIFIGSDLLRKAQVFLNTKAYLTNKLFAVL
jgi:hypothetical protein